MGKRRETDNTRQLVKVICATIGHGVKALVMLDGPLAEGERPRIRIEFDNGASLAAGDYVLSIPVPVMERLLWKLQPKCRLTACDGRVAKRSKTTPYCSEGCKQSAKRSKTTPYCSEGCKQSAENLAREKYIKSLRKKK